MNPPFLPRRRPTVTARSRRRLFQPLRESLDLRLFLRGVLGSLGTRLTGRLPRLQVSLPKEYCVHSVILLLVVVIVVANRLTTSADRGSLLFALFREAQIEEGPLPVGYRPASARGALLGLIPAAIAGGVTEEDLEFELANILEGNALVATASPETAEASATRRRGLRAYTVAEGDTPASIAARFGISTNTVLWANGIRDGEIIRAGDILVILPVSGVLHSVVDGDDVTSLALAYDAKVEDIIAANGLADDGMIRIGQKLVVPDGQLRAPRRLAALPEEEPDLGPAPAPTLVAEPGSGFLWPAASRAVSQYFGWRHTGVDVPAKGLQPVRAAQDATVAFAGWLGGYGRLVILDHGSGLRTYYAHLREVHVKSGTRVERGSSVGYMGCTGRCSGQHVHFEVRVGGRPVNPLKYF